MVPKRSEGTQVATLHVGYKVDYEITLIDVFVRDTNKIRDWNHLLALVLWFSIAIAIK